MEFLNHPYILLVIAILCLPIVYILFSLVFDILPSHKELLKAVFELDLVSIVHHSFFSLEYYELSVIRNIIATIIIFFGIYILFVCAVTEIICRLLF